MNLNNGTFWLVDAVLSHATQYFRRAIFSTFICLLYDFYAKLISSYTVALFLIYEGEEGEICLPHIKYAKFWCDQKVPCRRGLVSNFCNKPGTVFLYVILVLFISLTHRIIIFKRNPNWDAQVSVVTTEILKIYLIKFRLVHKLFLSWLCRYKMHCIRQL